jgi:hypothetical protein
MRRGLSVRSFLWSGTAAALFAAVTWTNTASSPVSGRVPARRGDIALPSPIVHRAPIVAAPRAKKAAVPTSEGATASAGS